MDKESVLYWESLRREHEIYCPKCLQGLDRTENALLYSCPTCRDIVKEEKALNRVEMT